MTAIVKLLCVAALIATNAFFVASEFALVSVRRTRLETRANNGSRAALAALRLLDTPTANNRFTPTAGGLCYCASGPRKLCGPRVSLDSSVLNN